MRSVIFNKASRKGRPKFCSSNAVRNSPATGSADSIAIISSPVVNACPARTARPSKSKASGKCSSKARKRRRLLSATIENGTIPVTIPTNQGIGNRGKYSPAIRYDASAMTPLSSRIFAGFVFIPACATKSRRRNDQPHGCIQRCSVGTLLSISSRTSFRFMEASPRRSAMRTDSMRRFTTSWLASVPMNIHISTMTATAVKNVKTESSSAIFGSLMIPRHFEHADRQLDPGYQQAFREPRTNPRGQEFADHLAVLSNATFPKYKNVLHCDNVPFHARDFRDADNFSGSIAEAAHLYHQVHGGGDLPPN